MNIQEKIIFEEKKELIRLEKRLCEKGFFESYTYESFNEDEYESLACYEISFKGYRAFIKKDTQKIVFVKRLTEGDRELGFEIIEPMEGTTEEKRKVLSICVKKNGIYQGFCRFSLVTLAIFTILFFIVACMTLQESNDLLPTLFSILQSFVAYIITPFFLVIIVLLMLKKEDK